jgi:hypothetical protein
LERLSRTVGLADCDRKPELAIRRRVAFSLRFCRFALKKPLASLRSLPAGKRSGKPGSPQPNSTGRVLGLANYARFEKMRFFKIGHPRLQPKSALSCFPPIHWAGPKGQQRVELAHSPDRPAMTAKCAKRPFGRFPVATKRRRVAAFVRRCWPTSRQRP